LWLGRSAAIRWACEHTDEILAETGYAAGEIETLRREGVV
jgi:hypothetical protein